MNVDLLDDPHLLEGLMHVSPSFVPKQKSKLFCLKARNPFPWEGRTAKTAWIMADAMQQEVVVGELFILRVNGEWEMRRVRKTPSGLFLESLSGRAPILITQDEFPEFVVGRVLHVFDITHLLSRP